MWSGAFSRFGLKAVRLTRPILTSKPTLVTVGVGAPLAALFGMSKKDKPDTPATGLPTADTKKAIGARPSETLGTNPEKAKHKAATLEGTHDKTVDEGKTATTQSESDANPDPEKLDVDLYKFSGDSSHPKEILPAPVSFAPLVPPPIKRSHPVVLRVNLDSIVAEMSLTNKYKYPFWTYNGKTPGPFIRARVGDVLEVVHTNKDQSGMPHNIDFHAAVGPGGGAPLTLAEMDQTKVARFKLTYPGLYVYHCGAAPVPVHIANGMYGLILVEPEKGMPPADKEFYVMQSEFYIEPPENGGTQIAECNYAAGLMEEPDIVVFNGREGALTQKEVLKATTDERVRIYFGNAGPNLTSSFHVIGGIFDKVYRDADLITPPGQGIAVTSVPPGGATVVELEPKVPGIYTLVDHAIFRLDKGAVGFLSVGGKTRPDLYCSRDAPQNCPGCKLHA